MKWTPCFITFILIGLSWSHDNEGGIHNHYDEGKWKNPSNPFGDDYDPDEDVLVSLTKKYGTLEEERQKRDEQTRDPEKGTQKNDIEEVPHELVKEDSINEQTTETAREPIVKEQSCYINDVSYFKHFIRIFSYHMQPLENEVDKYGAQVMLLKSDYDELQDLLKNDHANNNKLLDLMTKSFVPLSLSPLAFFNTYTSIQYLTYGMVGIAGISILFFLVYKMLTRPLSILKGSMIMVIVIFLLSVPWEWYRMYQKALSEKVANSIKLVPDSCKPATKISPLDSLITWLKDTFTLADDECIKYHESLLVDPIWEVSPLQAVTVCASRFFIEPMKIIASASGQSFRLFFKEVPAQWQPVVFFSLFVLTALLILTQAGVEIWTPFLRLGVRPRDDRQFHLLQNENARLRDEIKVLRLDMNQRLPIQAKQNEPPMRGDVENVGYLDQHVNRAVENDHLQQNAQPMIEEGVQNHAPIDNRVPAENVVPEFRNNREPARGDINPWGVAHQGNELNADNDLQHPTQYDANEDQYKLVDIEPVIIEGGFPDPDLEAVPHDGVQEENQEPQNDVIEENYEFLDRIPQ